MSTQDEGCSVQDSRHGTKDVLFIAVVTIDVAVAAG